MGGGQGRRFIMAAAVVTLVTLWGSWLSLSNPMVLSSQYLGRVTVTARIDDELDEQVVKFNEGLTDAQPVEAKLRDLKQMQGWVTDMPGDVEPTGRLALQIQLERCQQLILRKEHLIRQLEDSAVRLQEVAARCRQYLSVGRNDSNLDLGRELLVGSLRAGRVPSETPALAQDLQSLKELHEQSAALMVTILDLPTEMAFQDLYKLYRDHFTRVVAQANQLRGWLVLSVGFLLLLALWSLYRMQLGKFALEVAKTTLEERVQDRTAELRSANQALSIARDRALDANRAKSEFLAAMSHELRTPLNSVIGFTNVLLRNKEGRLLDRELVFLQRVLDNGKHLLGLINDVLDLSKIEARRMEIVNTEVSLETLVQQTVDEMRGRVVDRADRMVLAVDVPSGVLPLHTDGSKLKQVLINLVGNALKFTEAGSVTVRVGLDASTGAATQIDVIDTGMGIPESLQKSIFEPFQQGEAGTSRRFGGTGLGLSISRSLCLHMGYDLKVTSQVGQGSTFSIVLHPASHPVEEPTDAVETPEVSPPRGASERLALVVDDESDSRVLLGNLFEECGCRVMTASSGEEGLRLARQHQPQVMTVDLMMPHMDGVETLRRMKNDPELRDIPAIIVSVVGRDNRSRTATGTVVLDKPVSQTSLEKLLAGLMRR
jgi:signal transduction histidine kinase